MEKIKNKESSVEVLRECFGGLYDKLFNIDTITLDKSVILFNSCDLESGRFKDFFIFWDKDFNPILIENKSEVSISGIGIENYILPSVLPLNVRYVLLQNNSWANMKSGGTISFGNIYLFEFGIETHSTGKLFFHYGEESSLVKINEWNLRCSEFDEKLDEKRQKLEKRLREMELEKMDLAEQKIEDSKLKHAEELKSRLFEADEGENGKSI